MVKRKKKAYWKNLRKTILTSKARFFSIFAIVFLGAAFFAGLRNTPGTMTQSMDHYLDKHHYADLTYMASLGFSKDDISEIQNISGIEDIQYGYQFDALIHHNDSLAGVTVYASEQYDQDMLNQPYLVDGRYPQKDNECVIDEEMLAEDYQIGDEISIHNDQGEKTFKIVGVVNDVRYIAITDRGTNTLGDGTNAGYIEILNENNDFLAMPEDLYELRDEDILYNQISVCVKGAKEYNVFSEAYDDYIEDVNTKIKSTLSLKMSRLYEDLTSDAKTKLDEAQKEYDEGYQTYSDSKDLFDEKILEAKIQLTNAKITLATKEAEYLKAQSTASSQIQDMLETIESTSEELKGNLESLQKELENYQNENTENISPEVQKSIASLEKMGDILKNASSSLDGLTQLNEASIAIEKAKLEIQQQENQLTLEELKTNNELEKAQDKLDQAKSQLDEARDQVDQIPKGRLYTLTRHENSGLVNFDSNKDSISSIADIFPLMFFLVSALVSLTTMTRMVEEQRSQSGTLRALGYSKWDVMKQYIIYVIFATFFACILGIVSGTQFFPRIIYYLYNLMLFQVDAPISIYSNLWVSIETIFISVFVILAVTLFVCMSELNLMPAVLMRPKAPKVGKRILLERIPWLWKRFSFNQKVTMRNIFRYKKRFFMSVIGIAGCTALIITGFGVKSSVSQVVDKQYQDVFTYDYLVRLEDSVSTKTAQNYQKDLLNRSEVANVEYVLNKSINILKDKEDLYGSLIVYQSMDNMKNFVQFRNYQTYKDLALDDEGVILTAKAAELLGVEDNDTIDIELNETKYSVKVSGITENYFMNYIYMSQTLYESLTLQDLEVNNAFLILQDDRASSQKTLEAYMQDKGYGNLSNVSSIGEEFDKQVQSVNLVVVILIVCAGALNFIVLYNLTNINIQERKSEIATIKVLGFRRKEVYDYIFRENVLLSVIGSLLGMIFGYFLHKFIILTVELDMTMFVRQLNISSYIYAIIMTLGFTYFINFTMRHVLNKVDMVESLKSIE